jgi:hypothetical protein
VTRYELLKFQAFAIVARGGRIRCAFPGCTVCDIDALHLDHIKNDGHRDRKKHAKAGGIHTYRWVMKHPKLAQKRLQILCAIHDRIKQSAGSFEKMLAGNLEKKIYAKVYDTYMVAGRVCGMEKGSR